MGRLFVSDATGLISIDLEANGPILGAALDDEQAEALIRCAVLMALSALVEGGSWPVAAFQSMASFMSAMREEMRIEHLA